MRTSEMAATRPEGNPFRLKRKGRFSEALVGYAQVYQEYTGRRRPPSRIAQAPGRAPIAEMCFEQMFDVTLLMLLKERKRFEDKGELLVEIKARLCQALEDVNCHDLRTFDLHLATCVDKLFTRGRAVTPFSVDPDFLVTKRSATLYGEKAP